MAQYIGINKQGELIPSQPNSLPATWVTVTPFDEKPLRSVFVCKSCQGVYADAPVGSYDCMPDHHEFDSGVILLDKKPTV